MSSVARIAEIGALIGDPARCAMLIALMGGRALTASELAHAAGVAPSTASSHLAQLCTAGLLEVLRQGRHRYHRIATPEVARMIESVMAVAAPPVSLRQVHTGPREAGVRRLRTCYDHLAGSVAVAIAERMQAAGQLSLGSDGGHLTPSGEALLRELSIDLTSPAHLRPCLDWSERRFHLGGRVGAGLQQGLLRKGWIRTQPGSRAVAISLEGRRGLYETFGIEVAG